MKIRLTILWFSIFASYPIYAAESFWDIDIWNDPERGFLFYGQETNDDSTPIPRLELRSLTSVEDLRKETTRRLHIALMNPSEEHLTAYLEANHYLMEKSALFADMWRRTLWQHPEFDFTTQNPNANYGQIALSESRTTERHQTLLKLASQWGLIFIIEGGCIFCDRIAPIAKTLAETLKMPNLSVSLRGQSAAWPDALPDNGTVAQLQMLSGTKIQATPAVFLIKNDLSEARHVATGLTSLEELTQRIYLITSMKPGNSPMGGQDAYP